MEITRCAWPGNDDKMIAYHDKEWGVPVHEDAKLFEFLVLDAFQAGLSWKTILHRREGFRKAFDNFDYYRIAKYGHKDIERLMADTGIIRNKLKVQSSITNAQAFIKIQEEFGSFDKWIWEFTGGETLVNKGKAIPVSTPESDAMSKALIKRGFKFVGTTICYAFMQAAGMVNDHAIDCFRYSEVGEPQKSTKKEKAK
jgi:DNA-3-methyladenine glycosylase I